MLLSLHSPAVAGMFYPEDPKELSQEVERYLEAAKKENLPSLKGLIVPHAGYIYSGLVAGVGYRQLENIDKHKKWTIFLLGPSHHAYFSGVCFSAYNAYQTPLGNVSLSSKNNLIGKEQNMCSLKQAEGAEHCLEVQLPFLQTTLEDFTIIPLLTGEVDPLKAAEILEKYWDEDSFLIVSSDLSHYHSYAEAVKLDQECLQAIEKQDFQSMEKREACGQTAILIAMRLAKMKGWKTKVLDYRNSGDTSGDKIRVVGYGAVAWYK